MTGTLSLAAPAAATGVLVTLSSSAASVVVPATVVIDAGQSTATFDVATLPNAAQTVATLTVTIPASGSVRTATLAVGPLRLESLSIGFTQWPGGTSAVGLLTLSVAAPPPGVVVALQSSSPIAAIPGTVTIPPGAATQEFPIDVGDVPPTRTVTITASYGDRTSSVTFTAVALPTITSFACSPLSVVGGSAIQCSGTVSVPAPPDGWQLSVASSDPSASGPDQVAIAPSSTTFSFALATVPVTTATAVTIRLVDRATGFILYSYPIAVTAS